MYNFEGQEEIIRFVLGASEEENARLAAFAAGVKAAERGQGGKAGAGHGREGYQEAGRRRGEGVSGDFSPMGSV